MSKIILVAESGSDITPELAEKYGVYVVPMHVAFDESTLDDGTFPPEKIVEFYQSTGRLPRTSGSTPDDFTPIFDRIHAEHPDAQILYLAYSAITTCSYQSAVIASEDRDYITMLDTRQVSVGQAAVTLAVAETLRAHPDYTVEEVVKAAQSIALRTRMCFIPKNLDYLRAGGRVSNVVALTGNLLGLHPDMREVEMAGSLPKTLPAAVAVPTHEQLLKHPELKASLAAHDTSEAELQREIRKQYPELSVSPGFEHEDGNSKVGIGVGLSLPLWNRNQQGIAQAYGERDIKEYEALQTWRHLQQQAVSLSDMQALLLKHCRAEQERVAQLSDAEKKQEKLYAIGETKLPAVADARQEAYLRRLNYLECLTKLLTTQVELQYLNPDFIAK